MIICADLAKSGCTTTHPPCMTVKMATMARLLHSGSKGDPVPILNSLDLTKLDNFGLPPGKNIFQS